MFVRDEKGHWVSVGTLIRRAKRATKDVKKGRQRSWNMEIKLSDEMVSELKNKLALEAKHVPGDDYTIGACIFVRCVTHYVTGRIVHVSESMVHMEDAAWIADTGRFAQFLKNGTASEVEPIPGIYKFNKGAVVDVCEWSHPLPQEQK